MSLKITVPGGTFDLPPGFSTEIEDKSPAFNEEGSQSIATTVPGTKGNLKLCAHINRTDIDNAPARDQRVVVADGVYHRAGKMNIVSASRSEGITFNIGFAESELYRIWNAVSLQSLKLPVYRPEAPDPGTGGENVAALCRSLMSVDRDPSLPLEVFPVALSVNVVQDQEAGILRYTELINCTWKSRIETFFINGSPVEVSLPEGYGCVPFLRVSYIIEQIFTSYGFRIVENPFATHHQLRRLVVLNNAADCCVKGELRYSDLMPDCSINEFMQALWCRFGLLFFVDPNTRAVRLKFIRDILRAPHDEDWTLLKGALPVVHYEEPRQLKLSSATNVKGPSNEYSAYTPASSLDRFLKPYHYIVSTRPGAFLRYDPATASYYKRNHLTGRDSFVSSEFFPWDRGENMAYKEITSIDECLPIDTFRYTPPSDIPNHYEPEMVFPAPLYLFGKVHRYTSITSADIEMPDTVDRQTPLAFCFAFPRSGSYARGSQICADSEGNPYTDSEGRKHDISLTFVGKYGLFNHFWKEYDAMLRHAGHVVETDIHLSAHQRMNPDFAAPVLFDGQRMLPESIGYTLPSHRSFPARVKLRTLKLLKPFDLDKEQTVPVTEQRYTWKLTDNKSAVVEAAIKPAVEKFKVLIRQEAHEIGKDCHLHDLIYRNEKEEGTKVDIPLSVPSEADYNSKKEYFVRKVKYSFDLYCRMRVMQGPGAPGQLNYYVTELKPSVHFDIEYDQRIRADLF